MNIFSFFTKPTTIVDNQVNHVDKSVIEMQEPTVMLEPYFSITEDWFIQQNKLIVFTPQVSQETVQTPINSPIDINIQEVFDESKLLVLDCDESELEHIQDEDLDDVIMRLILDIL